jgi:hypothetical protein
MQSLYIARIMVIMHEYFREYDKNSKRILLTLVDGEK